MRRNLCVSLFVAGLLLAVVHPVANVVQLTGSVNFNHDIPGDEVTYAGHIPHPRGFLYKNLMIGDLDVRISNNEELNHPNTFISPPAGSLACSSRSACSPIDATRRPARCADIAERPFATRSPAICRHTRPWGPGPACRGHATSSRNNRIRTPVTGVIGLIPRAGDTWTHNTGMSAPMAGRVGGRSRMIAGTREPRHSDCGMAARQTSGGVPFAVLVSRCGANGAVAHVPDLANSSAPLRPLPLSDALPVTP